MCIALRRKTKNIEIGSINSLSCYTLLCSPTGLVICQLLMRKSDTQNEVTKIHTDLMIIKYNNYSVFRPLTNEKKFKEKKIAANWRLLLENFTKICLKMGKISKLDFRLWAAFESSKFQPRLNYARFTDVG